MRLRSEATGGYDFGPLIAAALAFLAVVVTGLIMLIIGIWRYAAGRPYRVMLWGGMVLLAPLVVLFFSAL